MPELGGRTTAKSDASMTAKSQSGEKDAKGVIADYWDLRSNSYAKGVLRCGDEERRVWRRCLRPIAASCKAHRVLDVGAGTGFLPLILHEMGLLVFGVDISNGMLRQAKEVFLSRKIDLELCLGDAEALPFRSSTFDLVTSRHLLWTLPDPAGAIEEWQRVLRPGGRLIAIDGNWFDPAAKKRFTRWLFGQVAELSKDRNPVPFSEFYSPIEKHLPLFRSSRPDRCQALFQAAGLREVAVDDLDQVNRFYRRNSSLSFRLANADAVFLATGVKAENEEKDETEEQK